MPQTSSKTEQINMSDKSGIASNIINLPQGGGAVSGLGESFSPDLFTGTGNFSVPIAVPPGRNGMQPSLSIGYSTGGGNGIFGLGWGLSVPGVTRSTRKGIPKYNEETDIFLLSGAEDLVQVEEHAFGNGGWMRRFRPRTEGLFARIERYRDSGNDYWKVWTKDGLVSYYGTPGMAGTDPAVCADPKDSSRVFGWKLSRTEDPFGNHILYTYERDAVNQQDGHHWEQLYLKEISYIDYDDSGTTRYLASVKFLYEDRPDPFSEYQAGFEMRTVRRCTEVQTWTHPYLTSGTGTDLLAKSYHFEYIDERVTAGELPAAALPPNGVSMLSRVRVKGHDGNDTEEMPPIDFGYSNFNLDNRDLKVVTGKDLPPVSLSNPDYEMIDLFGRGLPDIIQLNGVARYWRNLGEGKFDLPKNFSDAPAGVALADPEVTFMDANGDGRADLVVNKDGLSGYFPLRYNGEFDRKSFVRFDSYPSFSFSDPEVRLMDLSGNGVTDVLKNGQRFECYFNDPDKGFHELRTVEKSSLKGFPNVSFADPRVRTANMSAGLQDIVLIHNGNIEYWPNLGHGDFAPRIAMKNAPRFPYGYNPQRVLLGDIDGDGLDDLIFIENNQVTVWFNKSGNAWSEPYVIKGTPQVTDLDAIRLADLFGNGTLGILYSRDANLNPRQRMLQLDLNGGQKPYLLQEMQNNMGALTRVEYKPSTYYYNLDYADSVTRWETPLPMPVLCVARVEVIDQLSLGKLTTEYFYHHGYYDGTEREFRGFGRVDQRDTETFDRYNSPGLNPNQPFNQVSAQHYSPATESRTWFHLGPVGDEFGPWEEADFSAEYWSGDENVLSRPASMVAFLKSLPRRAKRDALRTLRGSIQRTEVYALDASPLQERPYTVTETLTGVGEVLSFLQSGQYSHEITFDGTQVSGGAPLDTGEYRIFFPHGLGQRTAHYDRGNEPMISLSFTGDYDDYGMPRKSVALAVPRTRIQNYLNFTPNATELFLCTASETVLIHKDTATHYLIGRPEQAKSYEVKHDPQPGIDAIGLMQGVLDGSWTNLELIGHSLNYYDGGSGDEFEGLPLGQIGDYGIVTRSLSLILTGDILDAAYGTNKPDYLINATPSWGAEYPSDFQSATQTHAGYLKNPLSGQSEMYYTPAAMNKYDFHLGTGTPKGLVIEVKDPADQTATVTFDDYELLPVEVEDALGMKVVAEYDYRIFQAIMATDPNENRKVFRFSPLGFLQESGVLGKVNEAVGDWVSETGGNLVWDASTIMEYDFFNFLNQGDPVWVRTTQKEEHYQATNPVGNNTATIKKTEYTDGFGRLLQVRAQAEDVIFGNSQFGDSGLPQNQTSNANAVGTERGTSDPDNVVVNGWTVYNNKGWVVEQYEPFFDQGYDYSPPAAAQTGQKMVQIYDPRGRVVRSLSPDGTEQRVIFGIPNSLSTPDQFTPTPWETYTYDANDLAPLTHSGQNHRVDSSHYYTPKSVVLDALGRTVSITDRNGQSTGDWYTMGYAYDIRGNLLETIDYKGRVQAAHVYDLKPKGEEEGDSSNVLRTDHLDGGTKTIVYSASMLPLESRDSKGALLLNAYDELLRPEKIWARDNSSDSVTLRQQLIYGDSTALTNPENQNLKGQIHLHFDEAGKVELPEYDFKGNPMAKIQRVIKDDRLLDIFTNGAANNWQITPFTVDWTGIWVSQTLNTTIESNLADSQTFRTDMEYDALNRIVKTTLPQDVSGGRKSVIPEYNHAGALEKISLDGDTYVSRISYNAKGQRLLVAYGNGIMQRYVYDLRNFRLLRMVSEKYTFSQTGSTLTYAYQSGTRVQDTAFYYDLNGNITQLREDTTTAGVGGSGHLDRNFSYDPLYRLLTASGREAITYANSSDPWFKKTSSSGVASTRQYTRTYEYDELGNVLKMHHAGGAGGSAISYNRWFNDFNNNPSQAYSSLNLLTKVEYSGTSYSYSYDSNGNLLQEGNNRHFAWDHADQLRAFFDQTGTSEPTVYAQYLYDAGGNRVKKIVRNSSGNEKVTVYLDGLLDYLYEIDNSSSRTEEFNDLHVMDDRKRIAVRSLYASNFTGSTSDPIRYNLEDHLGNACFTFNASGGLISQEEYYPFGESSFQDFTYKRYRFVGKERDEESGLYYYGMRYYAPWKLRFISVDPLALEYPWYTPYQYAGNKPIIAIDLDGAEEKVLTNPPELKFPNSPSEVFSLRDWRRFAVGEMEKLINQDPSNSSILKFDCADLALYLAARYHFEKGVNFSYTHPITGKNYSFEDSYFENEEGEFDELSFRKFVFGDVNARRADLYSGLFGAFGPQHLFKGSGTAKSNESDISINGMDGISFEIGYEELIPGDIIMTLTHTMPILEIDGDTFKIANSSGSYYGPGDAGLNANKWGLGLDAKPPGKNSTQQPREISAFPTYNPDGKKFVRYIFLLGIPENIAVQHIEPLSPPSLLNQENK